MRLWHKDLISGLPDRQLKGQWRELCSIAKSIAENGTPNHILVNKIMDYPLAHLVVYSYIVENEMCERGWNPDCERFNKWIPEWAFVEARDLAPNDIFSGWHDSIYLEICFYNLLEKYRCGAISEEEWEYFFWVRHHAFNGLFLYDIPHADDKFIK